ncbi:helix-turn-helix transcriptional regulator [Pandoraea pnomenusa]|uniref:helix-turn-helix transcriptional regulator n=1 Tax=Pandoraea pnomenusa TaxID=93220 RepID=UPI00333EB460
MRSKAYREAMAEANVSNRLAIQIRLLRESHGLSQSEFAKRIGSRQSAIARLEDPDYGKYSFSVLHRIAKSFDVAFWAEFVSFSSVLKRTADLSPQALTPLSYEKEFDESGEPTTAVQLTVDGSSICKMNYVTPVVIGGGTEEFFVKVGPTNSPRVGSFFIETTESI